MVVKMAVNSDGDRRRINKIWDFQNPNGHWFTFGLVGSGKNQVIVTLSAGTCLSDTVKQEKLHKVHKWN